MLLLVIAIGGTLLVGNSFNSFHITSPTGQSQNLLPPGAKLYEGRFLVSEGFPEDQISQAIEKIKKDTAAVVKESSSSSGNQTNQPLRNSKFEFENQNQPLGKGGYNVVYDPIQCGGGSGPRQGKGRQAGTTPIPYDVCCPNPPEYAEGTVTDYGKIRWPQYHSVASCPICTCPPPHICLPPPEGCTSCPLACNCVCAPAAWIWDHVSQQCACAA